MYRKSIKSILIMFLLIIGIQTQYSASNTTSDQSKSKAADSVITISDKNFEQCILDETSIQEAQDITVANVEKIQFLGCYNYEIQDISEISYFTNVSYIDFSENQISDISALGNLTNLQSLTIPRNQISDISALSNLNELYYLDFNSNNISDISPISNLKKIKYLIISKNEISDISALSNLENLMFLYANNNQISDVSPLANLIQIDFIDLDHNQISDVSALGVLENLQDLSLNYNQISDISPLGNLQRIISLFVEDQSIKLEDIIVSTNNELSYEVTHIDGTKENVILGSPINGTTTLSANWLLPITGSRLWYSGTVSQTVTYADLIIENEVVSTNEGSVLNSAELIELFGVENQGGYDIEVNISDIDFNVPGDYPVVFTSNSNSYNGMLTVVDLLPVITVNKEAVTIEYGSNLENILTQLVVESTEITSGDLNEGLIFDDSSVDYKTPGSYELIIKSVDDEGNTTSKIIIVVVEKKLSQLTGNDTATILEHTVIDEASLIKLFEVTNSDSEKISVDYSLVDVTKPGLYTVTFTDESGNILACELSISDIIPVLEVEPTDVSIQVGETLEDIIAKLNYSASEINAGDLNSLVKFDDSAIDYSKAGIYQLVVSVTDVEGNVVEKLLNVTVTSADTIPTPEVEEEDKVTPPTETQVKEKLTVEKKTLSETGDLIAIATIALLGLLLIIICVKKFINKQ